MNQTIPGSKDVSIFGLNVVEFVSTESGEINNIDVVKTQLYNYILFIIGLLLVLLSMILTLLIKKYVNKSRTKPGGNVR